MNEPSEIEELRAFVKRNQKQLDSLIERCMKAEDELSEVRYTLGSELAEQQQRAVDAEAERDALQRRVDEFTIYSDKFYDALSRTEEMNNAKAPDTVIDDTCGDCEHDYGNTILTTNPPKKRCIKCREVTTA